VYILQSISARREASRSKLHTREYEKGEKFMFLSLHTVVEWPLPSEPCLLCFTTTVAMQFAHTCPPTSALLNPHFHP
jgi:hypothetical protein